MNNFDSLNLSQLAALESFKAKNGQWWKVKLRSCWEKAEYKGIRADHAAALQELRNNQGPEWLNSYSGKSAMADTNKLLKFVKISKLDGEYRISYCVDQIVDRYNLSSRAEGFIKVEAMAAYESDLASAIQTAIYMLIEWERYI